MGTRHMIGVVLGGEFRIAQYGQWDGYPSGQGESVLNFLRDVDLATFTERVEQLHWITPPEQNAVNADVNWSVKYPHMTRDAGADILDLVNEGKVEFLVDSSDFALDSLFCEWAYVVDLDHGQFEVYKGFNKTEPLGRWAGQKGDDFERNGYYPVTLMASFDLGNLPETEEFLKLEDSDEEEE